MLKVSKKQKPVRVAPPTAEAALEQVRERGTQIRAAKIVRNEKRGKMSIIELSRTWGMLMKAHHPEVHFTVKQKTDLFPMQRHLCKLAEGGLPMYDFLGWAVEHWTRIIGTRLRRLKDKPPYPRMGFIVAFSRDFEEDFQDRARIERDAEMPLRERLERQGVRRGKRERVQEERPAEANVARPRPVLVRTPASVPGVRRGEGLEPKRMARNVEGSFGRWTEDDDERPKKPLTMNR